MLFRSAGAHQLDYLTRFLILTFGLLFEVLLTDTRDAGDTAGFALTACFRRREGVNVGRFVPMLGMFVAEVGMGVVERGGMRGGRV